MFVSNLPERISKTELAAMFHSLGRVNDSFIAMDRTGGRNISFAFIRFEMSTEAD